MTDGPTRVRVADAEADERARRTPGLGRRWWRCALSVLWAPRAAFAALGAADEDDESALQEPILAIVVLAGMTAILIQGGSVAAGHTVDPLVAAVFTYVAGGIYGAAAYLVVGLGVFIGVRGGAAGATFRTARHVVAFAAVPLAAAFVPLAAAVAVAYGSDFFTEQFTGNGRTVVAALGAPCLAWAATLLVLGLRVAFRLAWLGVATAVALGAVFVACVAAVPILL